MKALAPTEARTLHDDADLPRLAAVLPPWRPLVARRVPRSSQVQPELASCMGGPATILLLRA